MSTPNDIHLNRGNRKGISNGNETPNGDGHMAATSVPGSTPAAPSTAKQLLAAAAQEVVVDDPLTDKERLGLAPLTRFSTETLVLVADAYDEHAAAIGADFDSASVRDAIAFEQTHRPIAAQARAFAQRIEEQILARKARASEACMGMYQAMKGLSRLRNGAVLRPSVKQIAATLKVGSRPKVKPTQPVE